MVRLRRLPHQALTSSFKCDESELARRTASWATDDAQYPSWRQYVQITTLPVNDLPQTTRLKLLSSESYPSAGQPQSTKDSRALARVTYQQSLLVSLG
ncbi:hypothetical protein AN958_05186 [Leucoagaricus sp. SymC.cos]|nr:hypothetical protein AN958_05186 [Leucoagaricus sp. SymC.cos]